MNSPSLSTYADPALVTPQEECLQGTLLPRMDNSKQYQPLYQT